MLGHAYGGISRSDGSELNCPDEETVFQYLGWPYTLPERRV
jgi:DNA polymerase/3'-5' exonuclease PolX